MAWIESNQEVGRHPKTKKLARLLAVSLPETVGYLHYLWWWALDFAQNGDLSRFEAADIADAVMWEGEPEQFVSALAEAGFADNGSNGELYIHDWNDYAGRLVVQREKNKERMKRARSYQNDDSSTKKDEENAHVQRTCSARAAHVQNTTGATVPNSTVPNRTVPEQEGQPRTRASRTPASREHPEPQKSQYAEFVSMTNDEYTSLVAKLGEQVAKRCVEILDNYKGATGKTYKSDYRAILNWVVKRYEEDQTKEVNTSGHSTRHTGGAKPAPGFNPDGFAGFHNALDPDDPDNTV